MKLFCNSCQHIFAAEFNKDVAELQCPECQAPVAMPENEIGPGVVVDGFLIEKELGQGGMGKVYVAKQISLDRPVALKVLLDKFAQNREYVDGLVREARAAAKINHPNIVQSLAVGESEGVVYFAMELIRGETMKQRLKKEKIIKFDEAAKIIRDVASALDVAWREQKLVHQDIKPDNIMLDINGFAKLADLGLAKTAADPEEEEIGDEVLGTPQYISPEQLTGVPTDVRSDIYSLGATFYQFVTGRFPYVADTGEQLAHMHVDGNLQPPKEVNPDLPEELNAIIMKMMARDITKRYQSPALLIKALDVFLRGFRPPEEPAVPKFNIKKGSVPALKVPSIKAPPAMKKTAAPAPVSKIEPIAVPQPEKTETPVPAPVPVPVPVPVPAEDDEDDIGIAGVSPKVEKTAVSEPAEAEKEIAVPAAVPVTEEKKDDEKEEILPVVVVADAPEKTEKEEESGEEVPVQPRKKRSKWLFLIIPGVLLLVLLLVAGAWYFGRDRVPFIKTAEEKVLEFVKSMSSPKTPPPPTKTMAAEKPKPAPPPKPQTRKAFMDRINQLRSDAREGKLSGMDLLNAGDRFMLDFETTVTEEERLALELFVEEYYAPADEKLRFVPARNKLLEERITLISRREEAIRAEEERLRQIAENEKQRKAEAEAEKVRAEEEAKANLEALQRSNAKRLETAQREIEPLRKAIAKGMKEAVAAGEITPLTGALKAGKAYSLPRGIPGAEEQKLFTDFRTYCSQAEKEYELYSAFRKKLEVVSTRRPVQLRGKTVLITIVSVAPGKVLALEPDGSTREVTIAGGGMERQFCKQLQNALNRDKKAPEFTVEQIRFFYNIMNDDWSVPPSSDCWKQIISAAE